MLVRLRARLTYANVMATVAVFIALGGTSYAALRITGRNVPRNALTGADIKNLTGRDVRNNSLTGADVRSLTHRDVSNGRLLAEDFAPGQLPKGDTGPAGPQGPPGPQGAPGLSALQIIQADSAESSVSPKQVSAICPPGKRVSGTGYDIFGGKTGSSPNQETEIVLDFIIPGSTAVTVAAYEDEPFGGDWRVTAYAICATVP